MNILSVNTSERGGGAAKVATDLVKRFRELGHVSTLAVGFRFGDDPAVVQLPPIAASAPAWKRPIGRLLTHFIPLRGNVRGAARIHTWLGWLAEPERLHNWRHGYEDFAFPGSHSLVDCAGWRPDIILAHNLHGGYFDLRQLARLSQDVPVVLTLHDQWLLTGHCACAIDCGRWRQGCGACPNLSIYPAIRRDATARNWQVKAEIFRNSRLFVATPSSWLMKMVEESMLAAGVVEARVIPNGVDCTIFTPAPKADARRALDLPDDADILVFAAYGTRDNPFKDYDTIRRAVGEVAARRGHGGRRLIFVALGAEGEAELESGAEIRHVAFERDPRRVAAYYQAADLYLHAARVESFGMTIVESLACGTPVIATGVGGIKEVIDDLDIQGPERATGILVRKGDAAGMADAIARLLEQPELRRMLGRNAARIARERFDLDAQAAKYTAWFGEILAARKMAPGIGAA